MLHVGNAVMHGIHDVFPPDAVDATNPTSVKKLKNLEATWALTKEILGFEVDGAKKLMWLLSDKRGVLLTILKGWLRGLPRITVGIPLDKFESVLTNLQHAFIKIPEGHSLISPGNQVLGARPH